MRTLLNFILLLWVKISFSQMPLNLVPNASFEVGNQTTFTLPFCNSQLRSSLNTNIVISDWVGTPDIINNTPEWRSFNSDNIWNSTCIVCSPFNININLQNPFLDDKYVFIGKDIDNPNGEHLRTELYNSLDLNKKYKIRVIGQGALHPDPSLHSNAAIEVHLTVLGDQWHHPHNLNNNMMSMMYATFDEYHCKPSSFEHVFTATKNDLKQIVLQANNYFFAIDRVELYEYCTEYLHRQGRTYKFDRELEEAGTIIAGSVINNAPAMGNVEMIDGSITTYKASKEVILTEGFYVNRGADFTARIAPCGKECPSTDLNIPTEYVLCGQPCLDLISYSASRGLLISWSAEIEQNLEYLSSTNIINPIFCPPPGVSGVYEDDVVIQNACGETVTKRVKIKYLANDVPNPIINIQNSNLALLPDYPELSLITTDFTEYIMIDIMDCNGNVIHTNTYTFFNQPMPPAPLQYIQNNFLDPCGCYKIRITQKNYCNPTIAVQTIDWNRQQNLSNLFFPNVTICKDGKRLICFEGKGVKRFELQIFNNWGGNVLSLNQDYEINPYCVEFPAHLSNGVYYYIIKFIGCDGSEITANGSITVFNCDGQMMLANENTDTLINEEFSLQDSLVLSLSPNPTADQIRIDYTIPSSGGVKIKLLDKNLNELMTLVNSNYDTNGTFHVVQGVNNIPSGLNYCLLEFTAQESRKIYKRFTVVK